MLVVVRHAEAESRIVGGPAEDVRTLTARGEQQSRDLVPALARFGASAVISSPYRRAVATVAPTARALGLEVTTNAELREWDDGLETTEDWVPLYERCWQDPDHRYGDGESHRELSTRATDVLRDLLASSSDGTVIAASHGTWIARGLEGIGVPVSHSFWLAMPSPAVYEIDMVGEAFTASGPGLQPPG